MTPCAIGEHHTLGTNLQNAEELLLIYKILENPL
jgi:hypothetical protein